MTTIAEAYKLPPVRSADRQFLSLRDINGCHYKHMPELEFDSINFEAIPDYPLRMVTHGLYDERDGRRYWVIWSLWFEGKPFMLMRNAGREGDDVNDRYITDIDLYYKAMIYLKSFSEKPSNSPITDPNKDIPDLTNFYGHSLQESYLQNPPLTGEVK